MKNLISSLGLVMVTMIAQAYQTSDLLVRLEKQGQFTVVVNGQSQVSNSNNFRFAHLNPGIYPIQVLRENYWGSPSVLYTGRIRVPNSSAVTATLNHRNQMRVRFSPLASAHPQSSGGYGVSMSPTPPGYGNGHFQPVVCTPPAPVQFGMAPFQFNRTLQLMNDSPFDSDKLMIAKQAVRLNSVSSDQVLQLMQQLTFESRKLQFAKFAFRFVDDPENYFIVNDGFTFSSSIRELNQFMFSQG